MEAMMTLTGYVGHNIDLKQTKTGVSTTSFRVGTTPRYRAENGWVDGVTTWTTVVCYRALADHVASSIHRGDPVIVHGRIRSQSWVDAAKVTHEKMVLEATAIGHDLSRGMSAFIKPARPTDETAQSQAGYQANRADPAPSDPGDDEELADDIFVDELLDGESIREPVLVGV